MWTYLNIMFDTVAMKVWSHSLCVCVCVVLKVTLIKCSTVIRSKTSLTFSALVCLMKNWWRSGRCRFVIRDRCWNQTFACWWLAQMLHMLECEWLVWIKIMCRIGYQWGSIALCKCYSWRKWEWWNLTPYTIRTTEMTALKFVAVDCVCKINSCSKFGTIQRTWGLWEMGETCFFWLLCVLFLWQLALNLNPLTDFDTWWLKSWGIMLMCVCSFFFGGGRGVREH